LLHSIKQPVMTMAHPSQFNRWTMPALIVLTAALIVLRYFHLHADFPLGINRSGDLFNDEGWYANAAVRHFVYGQWYLSGDFNPIVSMPVGQLAHRLLFGVFGLGFATARLSSAIAFSAVIVLSGLLVRRHYGPWAGVLTALIIASYFPGFAFSRLALLESLGMGFAVASLYVADLGRDRNPLVHLIAAALLLVTAALAKSTMIFAVPVLAYIAWLNAEGARNRILYPLLSLAITLTLIGGYQLITAHMFTADDALFKATNLGDRQVSGVLGWLVNIPRKLGRMYWFGGYAFCIGSVLIAAATVLSASFRRSRLVHVLFGYGAVYFALQTVVWYGPARYFLPFIVPMAGLTAIACVELTRWFSESPRFGRLAPLPAALIAVIVLAGTVHIVTYMTNLKYSFHRMAAGVSEIIRQRGGTASDTIIFGNLADTTAIEAGFRAMNTTLSTLPLTERLEKYHPPYVLLHVDDKLVSNAVTASGGRLTQLGAWDVYENYYRAGQNVRLFSVDWSNAANRGVASP